MAGVLALAACGGDGDGGGGSRVLSGTLTVEGITNTAMTRCDGSEHRGYDDLVAGAPVVVHDGNGSTIATGELRDGQPVEQRDSLPIDFTDCEFRFRMADVPDAEFYTVEVSHRGEVTYSRSELEDEDWRVTLTIGD
ncbi:MAG: hypothetical protein ACRDY6_12755 [Acidimicrobiia bacterium]